MAFVYFQKLVTQNNGFVLSHLCLYTLFLLLSVSCFSRGVLGCAVLTLGALVYTDLSFKKPYRGILLAFLSGLPAALATGIIFAGSTGNHHLISALDVTTFGKMLEYASHVFLRNPFCHLFGLSGDRFDLIWSLGVFKIVLLMFGLIIAWLKDRRLFNFFVILILFDLGNSALLGLGRYHEGLSAAVSWRYQYASLICVAPILVYVVEQMINLPLGVGSSWGKRALFLLGLYWLFSITQPWEKQMKHWSGWRGREGREAMLKDHPVRPNWIGLPPIITYQEGKEGG